MLDYSSLFFGELEELVSDTHRGRRAELERCALGDLCLLAIGDDVGAVQRAVVLDPQRAIGVDADGGCLLLFNRKITMANIRMARN